MKRETFIVAVAIVLIVLFGVGGYYLIERESQTLSSPAPEEKPVEITDLAPGTGEGAKSGDTLAVHYRGTLADGTEFDSSYSRNQPFLVTLGEGQVIRGWEEGLIGMKAGGKRKLVIPPSKAYGARGQGPIPPDAALTFEIELLTIAAPTPLPSASGLPR